MATFIEIPEGTEIIPYRCFEDSPELEHVIIPESVNAIKEQVFKGWWAHKLYIEIYSKELSLPNITKCIDWHFLDGWRNSQNRKDNLSIYAPNLSVETWKKCGLGMVAAKTFIEKMDLYTDRTVVESYIKYISSQIGKLLVIIFEYDQVDVLRELTHIKKITKNNIKESFLIPSQTANTSKCREYLIELAKEFGEQPNTYGIDSCRDGIHYSFDGKKLLKCPDEFDDSSYNVQEGTQEIVRLAFCAVPLDKIFIPKSVTRIEYDAFLAQVNRPLYVKLPDSIKNIAQKAFAGGLYPFETFDEASEPFKYYYIATANKTVAESIGGKGLYVYRYPIYLGGPIDDLIAKVRWYAVEGFLFARENKLEDMSPWEESYIRHIKNDVRTYVEHAIDNHKLLKFMIEKQILSENDAYYLIEQKGKDSESDR